MQQKLQEIFGHDVPHVPCASNQGNEVLEHGCASSDFTTEMCAVLEVLYVFIASSTEKIFFF